MEVTVYKVIFPIILSLLGVKSEHVFADKEGVSRVTLVAEIKVENDTAEPILGYLHRVAVPVEGHMQQSLLRVHQSGEEPLERKPFRNGVGDYVELEWDIPARSTSVRKIYFDLLVTSYQFETRGRGVKTQKVSYGARAHHGSSLQAFLEAADYIESDDKAIIRLARQIEREEATPEDRLRAAFVLPQRLLTYRRQSTKGALYAVTHKEGDCTEYAALFVALARAMGYPARMTSEFLFTETRTFSQPNHHAAEVYLHGRWVPVDANLALDSSFGYGFGKGSNTKLVLNRNAVWVWSNLWPSGVSDRPGSVDVDMRWKIEIEGKH